MLARTGMLNHPAGFGVETPLLVPSFSSKGFRVASKGQTELKFLVDYSKEFLEESVLFSAFDVAHGNLPKLKDLPHPGLIFLDSGGYEISDDHDLASVYRFPSPGLEWTEKMLLDVYNRWPEHYSAVFVSFDDPSNRVPLEKQVQGAKTLLLRFPKQLNDFLMKPETSKQKTFESCLQKVEANPGLLSPFSVIGVTEKDLGKRFSDRIKAVVRLRKALDKGNIQSPIHVFGSLDPMSSCLYFLAGAEIFDGLTWLRYRYNKGISSYLMAHGLLNLDLEARDEHVVAQAIAHNLADLRHLKFQMVKYCRTGDIESFDHHRELLGKARDMIRNMGGD